MTNLKVGDLGQRYEVHAHNYPHEGKDCVICWVETLKKAESAARAINLAPSAENPYILDRFTGKKIEGPF